MNNPRAIIEIEFRRVLEQIHVRQPVRVYRPHVHPIAAVRVGEHALAVFDHARDDVFAEIVRRLSAFGIFAQIPIQHGQAEHVNPHRGQGAWRVFGFFHKIGHAVVGSGGHDAKSRGHGRRDAKGGNGHVRRVVGVKCQHGIKVHLVDVIAREDQRQIGVAAFDKREILLDGVGGAAVPVGLETRLVGLVELQAAGERTVEVPRPPGADVFEKRMGAVLREQHHVKQTGIDAVAQGKINDAVFARKRHRRLTAFGGEHAQPRTFTTGENDSASLHSG